MISRIAIFSQSRDDKTVKSITDLIGELCRSNIRLQLYEKSGDHLCCGEHEIERFESLETLTGLPDLVISVGGDGTFLETMLRVRELGIPVAGVNTGRLGFLANIPGEEVSTAVKMLLGGEYTLVNRSLLKIEEPEAIFQGNSAFALNEITVQKSDLNMINIQVFVDGVYLNAYWSDGLIISTATGSTAYNLSAGGPILMPEETSIVIVPISPHNLTNRPIVLPGSSEVRMVIEGRGEEYLVTCDFRWTKLSFSKEILITQPKEKLRTVMIHGTDFFGTLRSKLMWGADKRNWQS